MPNPPPGDTNSLVATSILLQRLHDEIPPDRFTLDWLMHHLHKHSSWDRRALARFGRDCSRVFRSSPACFS